MHQGLPLPRVGLRAAALTQPTKRAVLAQGENPTPITLEALHRRSGVTVATLEKLAAAAREGLGPKRDLMIDVGCTWDWKTAVKREEMLRQFDPFWIEEPLFPDDFTGYGELSRRSPTRIAAGEDHAAIDSAVERLAEGTESFAAARMNRGIQAALTGRKLNDL